jgi:hypothetical protein
MNKKILSDQLRKAVLFQIVNSSMLELVLDTYTEIKILNVYDHLLHNKLVNLKPSLERQSKKNYDLLTNTTDELVLKTYFRTQNAFEVIINVAKSGDVNKFGQLMDLLEAFDKNELTVIEDKDVKKRRLSKIQKPVRDV